jgi:hypothetical protein
VSAHYDWKDPPHTPPTFPRHTKCDVLPKVLHLHAQNTRISYDAPRPRHCRDRRGLDNDNQFERREERHHGFHPRRHLGKQLRELQRRPAGHLPQDRLDLVGHREVFAENFPQILARFDALDTVWSALINWKIPTSPSGNGALAKSATASPARANIRSCSRSRVCNCAAASLNFLYSINCRIKSQRGSSSAASSSGGCWSTGNRLRLFR